MAEILQHFLAQFFHFHLRVLKNLLTTAFLLGTHPAQDRFDTSHQFLGYKGFRHIVGRTDGSSPTRSR